MKTCLLNGLTLATIAGVLAGVVAEGHAHPNHPPVPVQEITTDLTWSKDIRPIFREKCMTCHSPSGTLPLYFDLSTYDGMEKSSGASDWAYGAAEEVLTKRMPPWGADPRYNSFQNHRYLTDAEIEAVVEWAHGGRPEGLKKDLPTPDEYLGPAWSLGQPDLVFELPEPNAPNAGGAGNQVTFSFPVELKKALQWVEAVEFRPGVPMAVHSMIALEKSGTETTLTLEDFKPHEAIMDSDVLKESREKVIPAGYHFLGQWVRGDGPLTMPASVGKPLRNGSEVELRIRYHDTYPSALSQPGAERSKLALYFAAEPVRRLGESLVVENGSFTVPAGAPHHQVRASTEIGGRGMYLNAVYPHLGRAGTDVEVLVHYPDGRSVTVLYVPRFDYALNQSYTFASPLFAPSGARVEVIAHYDNSEENTKVSEGDLQDLEAPADEWLVVYLDAYALGTIYRSESENGSD